LEDEFVPKIVPAEKKAMPMAFRSRRCVFARRRNPIAASPSAVGNGIAPNTEARLRSISR
jgi:hypothetical protein